MITNRFYLCAGIVSLALVAGTADARTFKPGSAAARWSIKTSVPASASLNHPRDVRIERFAFFSKRRSFPWMVPGLLHPVTDIKFTQKPH